jgi:riboflavin kinase/FMN adenylyltransferase
MNDPSLSLPAPWRLHELAELPARARGGHVVVGNFDGVHIGHRKVIGRASKLSNMDGRPVVAITFEPYPGTVLSPNEGFARITDSKEKTWLLKEAGADEVVRLAFDADLASLEPKAFVADVLLRYFEPKSFVVSQNFHLGRNRSGSVEWLVELVSRMGAAVEIIPPLYASESQEIDISGWVRWHLARGNIEAANRLLGRRWTIEGVVAHGDKRGRELGFPTANIILRSDARLGFGIYAVRVLVNGVIANGVASYGTRPQFDDGAPRLEVHILDFNGDLYGAHACVEFVAFQRPERTFSNVGALLQQMNSDCLDARHLLNANFYDLSIESVLERRAQLRADTLAD